MMEVLLPRTDAGVIAQAVVAAATFGLALALVRRHHEARLLVVGLATVTFAWMGLRALH